MLSRAFAKRTPLLAARRMYSVHAKAGHESEIRPAFTYAADPVAAKEYITLEEETAHHSAKTANLWMKISIFVVAPIVLATAYHTYVVEKEHFDHHYAHPRLPDDELPAEYEYQNIRRNKFFWGNGDKTLFWNDEFNHIKKE